MILGAGIALVAQGWKAYGPSSRITEADVQREIETRLKPVPWFLCRPWGD